MPTLFLKFFLFFWDDRALRGCSCGSRGFLEDRMMDTITGRAPPPAQAESHRPKGSRELIRVRRQDGTKHIGLAIEIVRKRLPFDPLNPI